MTDDMNPTSVDPATDAPVEAPVAPEMPVEAPTPDAEPVVPVEDTPAAE